MALPKIAIVGRPNVGKSALFNRICRKRIAIVDEAEGVTRDRLYAPCELFGQHFELIDTGGIDARSKADFAAEVREQAHIAIEEGDGLVMVVDGTTGPTDLDLELARYFLKRGKPLALAVNKVDSMGHEHLIHQFHGLGIEHLIGVSAIQGRGIPELLEPLMEKIPQMDEEESSAVKIALIGRPNVGKSTLLNCLLDESRSIVSPIAGTTRDSIDTPFNYEGEEYVLIDTAGIRRKGAEHEVVDKFAAMRTERAITRADICVLLLDAQTGMTHQEKRIATHVEEEGKGLIILMNKWDLTEGCRMEHALSELSREVPFIGYCPVVVGSAKTGRNVPEVMTAVKAVAEARETRISTSQLNKFIVSAMQQVHPPMIGGKRLRIYYMTQVSMAPARFLLFVNYPKLMDSAYLRYLNNQFRKYFSLPGNPIIFQLKARIRNDGPKPDLLSVADREIDKREELDQLFA